MSFHDLALQFVTAAFSPLVLAGALLFTLKLPGPGWVRGATAALAGLIAALGKVGGHDAVSILAHAASAALAGLLVAEVVLHTVPPVSLVVLRLVGTVVRLLRRRRP